MFNIQVGRPHQTVARSALPIKMIIVNNRSLGMVRQFQKDLFESRFVSTLWGYSAPDFKAVSESYGIPGRTVEDPEEIEEALGWLWSNPEEPRLLNVLVSVEADALPKMTFGQPLDNMEPNVDDRGSDQ